LRVLLPGTMSAAHLPATHLRIRRRYPYEQQRQRNRQPA
jgi:hypothetical protein